MVLGTLLRGEAATGRVCELPNVKVWLGEILGCSASAEASNGLQGEQSSARPKLHLDLHQPNSTSSGKESRWDNPLE